MKKAWRLLFVLSIFFYCLGFSFGQVNSKLEKKADSSLTKKQTGFYNVTVFSPVTFTGQFLSGIQTICGYKVNRYIAIGSGIGYEQYSSILTYEDFTSSQSLLPVFADIRYTPLQGKISPVIALNGGYKILLKNASTQIRYYSVYSAGTGVSQRDDYSDYNTYNTGGPFMTAEIGLRDRLCKHVALYLAADYSLWSISGMYYQADKQYLLGSDGWVETGSSASSDKSLAYVHVFLIRFGVVF
jgi:hypothetical protein